MIRLLADENVAAATVRRLRAEGHDTAYIAELSPAADDLEVLRTAREQERVLLTFDSDFGELIFRDLAPVPPGVVYLRLVASHPEEPAEIVIDLLSRIPADQLLGRFSVVTREHLRQRDLP